MNNINFIPSMGSTLNNKKFILFNFIKDKQYNLYDEELVCYEDNTTFIKKYHSMSEISYLCNMSEEEYFMYSLQWDYELPMDLCIKLIKLSTEHYSNNNTLIDNKITTIEY